MREMLEGRMRYILVWAHLRRSCHISLTPPTTTQASELDLPVTRVGLRPAVRFAIAFPLTLAYVAFAYVVSEPWRDDLRTALSILAAWVIPLMLAYVPSLVIGFLCFTLILTRYRPPEIVRAPAGAWPAGSWPPVTIVVAAWNEEDSIAATLERLGELNYEGDLFVILADNNSSDRTAERAQEAAGRLGLDYRRIFEPEQGKWRALNRALAEIETPIVVTLDADTFLQRDALRYLVARVASRPQDQHVSACAGALIPENPTSNFLTRMQAWDYRLGINGVKAMQAAYNSTLVAQGAFSAYWCEDVRAVGGWPDAIGEDIVLTWSLLGRRSLVLYEPVALGYTSTPERLARFTRQRSRWARGMFEGISVHPPHTQPRFLAKAVASIDYLVPVLDIGFLFFWVPGVILFLFGYPLIFGWWSLLVLPVTFSIYACMRVWQTHHIFRRLDIHPERNTRGFFGYVFIYQGITSAAALRGYWQYLRGGRRRWR
jgi:biofilm PGA synthesis N-glycosyltransferase PgaC